MGVDILGVDILGVDILGRTRHTEAACELHTTRANRVIRSKVKQVGGWEICLCIQEILYSAILQDACSAALIPAVSSGLKRFLMHAS